MNHGSLFSGIGGFDLAAEWMGWNNVFHCEWNDFGKKVLKYYWPNAISYDDITKTDFTIHRGGIDIITGGFPCQPYSTAGKREGKNDERHLWPECIRIVREIQPQWCVFENVSGLISWNGGMVFDEVQVDLEAAGYEVIPFILPACGVNAPHRRDRVWFVARRVCLSEGVTPDPGLLGQEVGQFGAMGSEQFCQESDAPDPTQGRLEGRNSERKRGWWKQRFRTPPFGRENSWQQFPTQSPVRSGNDGLSTRSFGETFSNSNTMDRDLVIKGALDAGRLIVDFETGKIYSTTIRDRSGEKVELPGANCNGYRVHNIYFNGVKKQCRAHQIIWIAAHGLYDKNTLMIDHKDRIRTNNALYNLRLVDAVGNRANSTPYDGKLSQEEKDRMFFLYKEGNVTMSELSEDFGISKSRVQQLISEHSELVGITVSKHRNESIKAYGNAIVPQVAFQIFKAIQQYENQYP